MLSQKSWGQGESLPGLLLRRDWLGIGWLVVSNCSFGITCFSWFYFCFFLLIKLFLSQLMSFLPFALLILFPSYCGGVRGSVVLSCLLRLNYNTGKGLLVLTCCKMHFVVSRNRSCHHFKISCGSEGNSRTGFAACPVLPGVLFCVLTCPLAKLGTKWISLLLAGSEVFAHWSSKLLPASSDQSCT